MHAASSARKCRIDGGSYSCDSCSLQKTLRPPREFRDYDLDFEPGDGGDDEESVILSDDDDGREERGTTQEDTEVVDAMERKEKEGEEEYTDNE